jgi:hypothetical protein
MDVTNIYGSQPDNLTELLEFLTPEEKQNLRTLDFEESKEIESASLSRLPQTSWGTINWDAVSRAEQYEAPREPDAAAIIRDTISAKIAMDSPVVIFWANLATPTVSTTVPVTVRAMDEIIATSHDIWLYFPVEGYIIEHFHEGRVTIARL